MFKIIKRDKRTNARTGVLTTPHGEILTPAYTIVATKAEVKYLKPSDIPKTKTQVVIANTYHLWDEINAKRQTPNAKRSFLIDKLGRNMPTMTDSGGFQVFSLGFGKENKVGKILKTANRKAPIAKRKNIKITGKGVFFNIDPAKSLCDRGASGKLKFLGPELSMELQQKLGADIIFAFDECTSSLDSYAYNKKALGRTHRWAKKCLAQIAKGKGPTCAGRQSAKQMLFGIVQGGRFKNLRLQSAKFIGSLPFDGFGIGGSFGKDEMLKTLKLVIPNLPEQKPRHLLGIGKIKDVLEAVENGIDLFDCVIPTREARHGRIYAKQGHYDISNKNNRNVPLEKGCKCPSCAGGIAGLPKITRAELYKLFKQTDKSSAYRYSTIHNVWFFNNLMKNIRTSIDRGSFKTFKKKILSGI